MLQTRLLPHYDHLKASRPVYRAFRAGDVLHSQADISKATHLLGYFPTHNIEAGLDVAMEWYIKNLTSDKWTGTRC
jgi:UDP-N-acetylglucosamine 4-epimerase